MGKFIDIDKGLTAFINSNAGTKVNQGLANFSQTKVMKGLAEKQLSHNTQNTALPFILGPAASIILKDMFQCGCYVYNDMTNKKIPPEQRPFSAAMDLANGVVSVCVMAVVDKGISPNIKNLYANNTQKYFTGDKLKKVADAVAKKGGISAEEALKRTTEKAKEVQKSTIAGFGDIASLIVVGIIAKRVFSPLISTPLASAIKPYVQKIFGKKKEDTKSQKLNTKA